MCFSRLREYGSRPSLSLVGAVIVFPVGRARRQERGLTGRGAAGGGAVGIAGRPGSEIGGLGRVVSPTSMRMSLASAAWRSCSVAVGPMQRNHSAVEVIGIDISGPRDVRERRPQVPRISLPRLLRRGFSCRRRQPNPGCASEASYPQITIRGCLGSRHCCVVSRSPCRRSEKFHHSARGAAPASSTRCWGRLHA
jgi:hypothetical protein